MTHSSHDPAREPVEPPQPVRRPWPAPADSYEITFRRDHTEVRLAGEVDAAMTGLMELGRSAIAVGRPITVDVADVVFMDSVGCGFLALLVVGIRPQRVRVVGAGEQVRLLLMRLKLDTVLDLDPVRDLDPARDSS